MRTTKQQSAKKKAETALARDFADRPGVLDRDLRAEDVRTVVVPTVADAELKAALDDIGSGDGGELAPKKLPDGRWQRPKLHSAYSSCALALNTFGPWRIDPASLTLLGRTGFAELRFEKRLPIFRGGRAPNLDLVVTTPGFALAIESKLTEHLARKPAPEFSDAYDRLEEMTSPSWWVMYRALKNGATSFTYVDAAQLVKHYFGLRKYCKENTVREATLLYLYWEPEDADQHAELRDHAEEAKEFRKAISDPVITFETMSYPQLWSTWDELSQPSWLSEHVAELKNRYAVRLG